MTEREGARGARQLRPIRITRDYLPHAEGSVLIEMGNTHVVCTASITNGTPRWLKGSGQGWITAEYGMLPRSTSERMRREAAGGGGQGGRTMEIQRLIGRSLRAVSDLYALGDLTITVDCDVIRADGGTRCASINGAAVALYDALQRLGLQAPSDAHPGGRHQPGRGRRRGADGPGLPRGFLGADTDMNLVMAEGGGLIEIQGTAEQRPFTREQLDTMLDLGTAAMAKINELQRKVLEV